MMEQALNVIYFLAEHPETIAENILQKMATCLLEKSGNNTDTEDSPKSPETENGKKRQKKKVLQLSYVTTRSGTFYKKQNMIQ